MIGNELEVCIERIVPNGFGIGFADGLTVFTPLTAPGDLVRVRITQRKKKIAFAEVLEVLEPSLQRQQPPCKYFGTCGGCDFQQLAYEAQRAAKVEIIKDCLHRIGKIEFGDEIKIIPSPKPLAYRTRAQWHLDTRQRRVGYFKRGTHEVIDIEHCPILDETLDGTLQRLRSDLDWNRFWAERVEIEAAKGDDDSVSVFSSDIDDAVAEVAIDTSDGSYAFNAQSFFQGNRSMIEPLLEAAAEGTSGDRALDLYCGVGLFSLPLARHFTDVIGVEGSGPAFEFAMRNAASAGLANVKFFNDGVAEFLRSRELAGTDLVLLDPPRTGTEKGVIERIVEIRPRQISYVACDPAMLARDLRALVDGGYAIDSITALDLFPQTHHVETVARLTR